MIDYLHLTSVEHIILFNTINNNQPEYKTDLVEDKINYSLLVYNNTKHYVTKLKPYKIITGRTQRAPFELDIDKQVLNNYVENHKQKMKIRYNSNKKILNNITHIIT